MNNKKQSANPHNIDWMITLLPLIMIIGLCVLFFCFPTQSNTVLSNIRFLLGDTFGVYYLIIGLGIFLLSIYVAVPNTVTSYLVPRMKSLNFLSSPGGL